ncbi:MAG TPA: PAS domain-containing protein [Rhizomicrobium sp.]|nr:PAS domain-containing protein [Rhizomicrobium sp.]
MNVLDAVRSLNQRAIREHWHYVCDPELAFSQSVYENLLQLWRSKAGDRPMPRRSEMTLRDLKDVLRNLIIVERVERNPSRYRARLIGTSLTSMAGDRTGKMIEEVLPPEHAMRWVVSADLILESGRPMRFIGRVELQGKEYLNAENLFVPLADDQGEPTFVMGLCRYTPRRSEDDESWENQIASIPGGLM